MAELNVAPRTIFNRDNLDILEGINSECIDLIYLDPPFNKKKTFTAPIGSSAEGAAFSDIFKEEDIKDEWVSGIAFENPQLHDYLKGVKGFSNSYNYCYLVYMAVRLLECHRILKNTGSVYLHCDPTMSHYLKIVMDCVFGENQFRNEIVWHYYSGGASKKAFAKKHDVILFYSKSNDYMFNAQQEKKYMPGKKAGNEKLKYATRQWREDEEGIYTMIKARDAWYIPIINPMAKERTGYPTQKPTELLSRIIQASSNPGEIVLDPFCGCATTCVSAEELQRQWIGIDVSYKAYELVKQRLKKEVRALLDPKEPGFQTTPPVRTDIGKTTGREGSIYIIANKAFKGMYKVGVSKNVKRRLAQYQTSDPHRGFYLVYEAQTADYRTIEKDIHERFDNNREWVQADKDEIIAAIKNMMRLTDVGNS